MEKTPATSFEPQHAQAAQTRQRYVRLVLTAVWDTVRDVKELRDYFDLIVGLLAAIGIIFGGIVVSWKISLPAGVAVIAWVGLARGGYRAWRDQVRLLSDVNGDLTRAIARVHQLEATLETAERHPKDPELNLRIEPQERHDATTTDLVLRCTNEGDQEIVDLSARIVGEARWANGIWTEMPVGEANVIPCAERIAAGSAPMDLLIARRRDGEGIATVNRFCLVTKREVGGAYIGDPEHAKYSRTLTDSELRPGRHRWTIAFEAPGRRTHQHRICFSFALRAYSGIPKGLNWMDPATCSRGGDASASHD
jgi:hypothetical protein